MITFLRNNISIFLTFIFTLFLFFVFYTPVFLHPNDYLFAETGDGIKNYFTYAGYISNNHSWVNFDGMNYPYGEHIFYTDCTPFLALIVKGISWFFPSIVHYEIGLLNVLLLVSYIFCAIYLLKIYQLLKINSILAVLSAIAYTLLCPQIFRLTGHLALGTSCVIPMAIYLLLKNENLSLNWKTKIEMAVLTLVSLLIHAYLGIIVFTTFFGYFLVSHFYSFSKKRNISWKEITFTYGILFMPLIAFYLFVFISDSHIGRTTNPFGFFSYYSQIHSFFIPVFGPFMSFFNMIYQPKNIRWESVAYVGILSTLVFFWFVINFLIKGFKPKHQLLSLKNNSFIFKLFLLSIGAALYAMCIPFRFNLHLVDYFSMLKQFRALGRFGWIFYFGMSVVTVYMIQFYLEKIKSKISITVLSIVFPMFTIFEGLDYHRFISRTIQETPNYFQKEKLNPSLKKGIKTIKQNVYQAIIPLPFFYIGSENHERIPEDNQIITTSMITSFHLKLPLISTYLSRTSLLEAKRIMQVFAPPFYEKEIQNDIHSKKPFLVLTRNVGLSPTEKFYLSLAKLVYKGKDYSFYSLTYADLFQNKSVEIFKKYTSIQSQLYCQDEWLTTEKSPVFWFDFDQKSTPIHKQGKGSFVGNPANYEMLAEITSFKMKLETNYKAQIWVYNNGENYGQDQMNQQLFVQVDDGTGAKWISKFASAKNSSIIDGNWTMIELDFKTLNEKTNYQFMMIGDALNQKKYIVDDLLITEAKNDVYKPLKNKLFYNNHLIRTEKE